MNDKKSNIVIILIFILLTIFIATITSFVTIFLYEKYDLSQDKTKTQILTSDGIKYEIEQVENPVVAIAEIAGKSVVGVKVISNSKNIFYGSSYNSEGSGIIYSSDGYIVTNYHVIEDAIVDSNSAKVYITFANSDEELEATIVGYDNVTDIAVVKVEKDGLVEATFETSEELKVGEMVVTIGNPLGQELAGSITVGYISALNRTLTADGRTYKLLQTDAAINPGNSGGALVNTKGKVIGINTVKIGATEVEGIGFAIPSDIASPIIEELIANGKIIRPYIGISGVNIDEESAKRYKLVEGIYIASVEKDSSADLAGAERGDIIVKIEDIEVNTIEEFNEIKNSKQIGEEVKITVNRNNEDVELKVILGADT